MGTSSLLTRLLLILILATGFFVSAAEDMTRKCLADTVDSICTEAEDAEDESDPIEPCTNTEQSVSPAMRSSKPNDSLRHTTPLPSRAKLFLLYQQWKLHC